MLCLMAACCYGNCWDVMTNTAFKFTSGLSRQEDELEEATLDDQTVPGSNWQSQWEQVWKLGIVGGQRAILIQLPSNLQAFRESWGEQRRWCCHFGEREISAWLWCHCGFLRKCKGRFAVSTAVQYFSNVSPFGSGTNHLFSSLPEFFSPESNWIAHKTLVVHVIG